MTSYRLSCLRPELRIRGSRGKQPRGAKRRGSGCFTPLVEASEASYEPGGVLMREYRLFIDGEFVDAASNEVFETTNPSTGEVVAKVARGGKADVERAVAAARRA